MNTAQVDLMSRGTGTGEVVRYLQANGKLEPGKKRPYLDDDGNAWITVFTGGNPKDIANYKAIQVNDAVLKRDEWKALDDAVIGVSRERLSGFDYLIGKGLVFNLPNAMGTTVLEWNSASDSQEAIISMDAVSRGLGDRIVFKNHYLPIPILHADYEINERFLSVSRSAGNGIDVSKAEHAARRILEKQEDMMFTDTKYSWGDKGSDSRNSIYSFLNYPDRNLTSLVTAWNAPSKTAAQILDDVTKMKDQNITAKFYGPYTLFIPTEYDAVLDEDYSVSGASLMTIRERIMKLNNINDIVVVDRLPSNNVLLVQMTANVVRIINGLPLQNIHWTTEGGMVHKYKVLTIRVPQIRSDYDGKTGISHMS